MHDHTHQFLPTVLISLGYIFFVAQLFLGTKWNSTNRTKNKPILSLIFVFIFCDFTGYASTLINDDVIWKETFRTISLWLLVTATYALVFTNQAGGISKMLMDDD